MIAKPLWKVQMSILPGAFAMFSPPLDGIYITTPGLYLLRDSANVNISWNITVVPTYIPLKIKRIATGPTFVIGGYF